jgi:CheY-like chemotaxis protein/HPt (histidine-containing phosphotransfer) domain-containing protein
MKPDDPAVPHLLLVEDDPVSAAFLREAASALPATVDVAGSVAAALATASTRSHDLYLVDANLPDGRGEHLLAAMRERGWATPALAHTAASDAGTRTQLLAAGFEDVLCKPIPVAGLHDALRRHLRRAPPSGKPPCWDDDAALGALGGQRAHVETLRALFLKELPDQRGRIGRAVDAGDEAAVRAELHRLVASCGFVGAARLGSAVRALQATPMDPPALQRLGFAIDDLLASA